MAPDAPGAPRARMDLHPPEAARDTARRTQLSHPADALGLDGMVEISGQMSHVYLGEVGVQRMCWGRPSSRCAVHPASAAPPLSGACQRPARHAGRAGAGKLSLLPLLPRLPTQTFAALITLGNQSGVPMRHVTIKIELATERAGGGAAPATVLADNSGSPIPQLPPGGRHDLRMSYDVRDLGTHTMACSTVFTGGRTGCKRWGPLRVALAQPAGALPAPLHPAFQQCRSRHPHPQPTARTPQTRMASASTTCSFSSGRPPTPWQ